MTTLFVFIYHPQRISVYYYQTLLLFSSSFERDLRGIKILTGTSGESLVNFTFLSPIIDVNKDILFTILCSKSCCLSMLLILISEKTNYLFIIYFECYPKYGLELYYARLT